MNVTLKSPPILNGPFSHNNTLYVNFFKGQFCNEMYAGKIALLPDTHVLEKTWFSGFHIYMSLQRILVKLRVFIKIGTIN